MLTNCQELNESPPNKLNKTLKSITVIKLYKNMNREKYMHRNFEIIIIAKLQNNAFLAMQSSRDFCFHFFFF